MPCMVEQRTENERAWKILAKDVVKHDPDGNLLSLNLDVKNPRGKEDFEHLPPEKLVDDIHAKEEQILSLLAEIRSALHG